MSNGLELGPLCSALNGLTARGLVEAFWLAKCAMQERDENEDGEIDISKGEFWDPQIEQLLNDAPSEIIGVEERLRNYTGAMPKWNCFKLASEEIDPHKVPRVQRVKLARVTDLILYCVRNREAFLKLHEWYDQKTEGIADTVADTMREIHNMISTPAPREPIPAITGE
jgi:hypothetical protein